MLRTDLNEALSRVGPGTPMGELFRRFWLPAILTDELAEPGCPPVRLRILGEDLVGFRDSRGRVGIIDAYCSHRLAPLFFGRNEECGLRCVYHGWKFDVDGNCLETPNVPPGAPDIRKNVGVTAYPTHETGGVVWIYMGPAQTRPPFPALEYTGVPRDHVFAARWLQRTNWSQGLEGEIDSSHISWLHRDFDRENTKQKAAGAQLSADGAPHIELRQTDYGLIYGARRDLDGQYQWRVTQFILPMFSLIPRAPGDFTAGGGRAWVPVDDNHTTVFTFGYRVDHPIGREELDGYYLSGGLFPPRMEPGRFTLPDGYVIDTFLPIASKENDYLLDREMQRTVNFSGIWGVHDQDRALAENSRPLSGRDRGIVDRAAEHLVSSDRAVVAARRLLVNLTDALAKGTEPAVVSEPSLFAVRAISRISPIASFDEFMAVHGEEIRATGVHPPVPVELGAVEGRPCTVRPSTGPPDGEGHQAAGQEAVEPADLVRGEFQPPLTREVAEGDGGLQPGQRGAEAQVDAAAEGDLPAPVAPDVEPVRVGEGGGVAVGGRQDGVDVLAWRDGDAAELDLFWSDPQQAVAGRSLVAEDLLHGRGDDVRVRPHVVVGIRVGEEQVHPVGDQVLGGAEPGRVQQHAVGDDLVVGQRLLRRLIGFGLDELRDDVAPARMDAALADERGEVVEALAGRGFPPGGHLRALRQRFESAVQRAAPGEEALLQLSGDADEAADQPQGHPVGEVLDEVELVAVPQPRQQAAYDLADVLAAALDRARGEQPGDQAAQPGVVGWVAEREAFEEQALGGRDPAAPVHLVAAPAAVPDQGLRLGVRGHQDRAEGGPVDGRVSAEPVEEGVGIAGDVRPVGMAGGEIANGLLRDGRALGAGCECGHPNSLPGPAGIS
jgi:phthalate 4,5-dioxygenase oxygenase subunit